MWALLLLVAVTGLEGIISKIKDRTLSGLASVINIPLSGSILGGLLTLIMLVFHLQPIFLAIPVLDSIFGITFFLDAISAFTLFCLFTCSTLFFFFKRDLTYNHYFILCYLNTILLMLAGNLFLLVCLLALFIVIMQRFVSDKNFVPLISLMGLLVIIVLLPNSIDGQLNFSVLDFSFLRQTPFSPYLLFFLFLIVWSLLGFFPLQQWRMSMAKHSEGDFLCSFGHLLMSMVGFYILSRFFLDISKGSSGVVLSTCIECLGLIAAGWAGWYSLVVKNLHERAYCLFILGNGILVQMVGAIAALTAKGSNEWLPFAYNILFWSIYLQLAGFCLVFLLIGFYKEYHDRNGNRKSQNIPSPILLSLLFLSFLLSGFPPFAGFTTLWGDLQLLLVMPKGDYLIVPLIATAVLGLNAIILMLSLLGWLRLVLTGGVSSFKQGVNNFLGYFSLSSLLEIKICIVFLFILSVIPGFLFLLTSPVAQELVGTMVASYSFFSFHAPGQLVIFRPWVIIVLFTMVIAVIGWVARWGAKGKPTHQPIKNSVPSNRSSLFEETSFTFGQAAFQLMLQKRFSFMQSFVFVYRYIYVRWIRFTRRCDAYTVILNREVYKHQEGLLLVIISIGLLSIGLMAL